LAKRCFTGRQSERVFNFERAVKVETEKNTEGVSVRREFRDRRRVSVLLKGGLGRRGEVVGGVFEDLQQDLGLVNVPDDPSPPSISAFHHDDMCSRPMRQVVSRAVSTLSFQRKCRASSTGHLQHPNASAPRCSRSLIQTL